VGEARQHSLQNRQLPIEITLPGKLARSDVRRRKFGVQPGDVLLGSLSSGERSDRPRKEERQDRYQPIYIFCVIFINFIFLEAVD
jgi:hypothetical protein